MRRIVPAFMLFVGIFLSGSLWAQSPEKMSYQAVIRNSSNTLLANVQVGMKISILQGSANGTVVYAEIQTPVTNANGLVSLEIGTGRTNDSFEQIEWANGPYFIKTETDPTGGENYNISGTSQLLSVPYALHAKTAGEISGGISETDPKFTAWDKRTGISIFESQIMDFKPFTNDNEIDPYFFAWDKSTGITISESQIRDLKHFTNANECDPFFSAWDKSSGISISESQITDLKHFTNADEIDPFFTGWDKHTGINITESQITDLKHFTNADESDPVYASDSFLIKTGVRSWNSSIAKGIAEADTSYWNNKTYISDHDGDTKIEAERSADGDVLHFKVSAEDVIIADDGGLDFNLPTNDNTTDFKVMKNNGTTVFSVDGSGRMQGDGSGLSNVKSLANSAGGNSMIPITKTYAWYQNIKSVSLTVPSSGKCFVMASGYLRWESTGWDLFLGGILRNANPNESWNAENEWYSYLCIVTDYNCADSSDQYAPYAQHRCFNVNAGTHTFTLWGNKYTSSAKVRIDDVNITVLFFPTAGTGVPIMKSTQLETEDEMKSFNSAFTDVPRRPDGTEVRERIEAMMNHKNTSKKAPDNELMRLQKAVDALKTENENLRKEKNETDKRISDIEKQVERLLKSK